MQHLSMKAEIIDYDYLTGELQWSADFSVGLPEGTEYEVAYEFSVVFGLPEYFSVVTTEGSCDFDPGIGQCYDSRVVPNAVPNGMEFLGFALQGFSMRADSGLQLGRIAIDVSEANTVFYPPGARRNTMTCDMLGLNASGQIEDYRCTAQIIGIAYRGGWLDDNLRERGKTLIGAGAPLYVGDSWSTNAWGQFSALKKFALQSETATFQWITDMRVGCEQAHVEPQTSSGVVVWGADFRGFTSDTWLAEQECMIGGLTIGL